VRSASVAIALVLVLSTVAVALQRQPIDEPVIPTALLFSAAPSDTGVLASPLSEPIGSPFGAWSLIEPVPTPDT
jgi:hypothetical protein